MGRQRFPITNEDREKVVKLYKAGVSSKDIASRVGCRPNLIPRIVKAAGEEIERRRLS